MTIHGVMVGVVLADVITGDHTAQSWGNFWMLNS